MFNTLTPFPYIIQLLQSGASFRGQIRSSSVKAIVKMFDLENADSDTVQKNAQAALEGWNFRFTDPVSPCIMFALQYVRPSKCLLLSL